MPRVTVDTSEAVSFEPAEPGPYEMTINKIDGPHKGEKSNYMAVEFQFQDPDRQKKHGSVFRNYPIDGKGSGFFRDFWKAATGQDLPIGQKGLDIDTDDALGRPVIVQIGNRDYQGRTLNEAERVTAAG